MKKRIICAVAALLMVCMLAMPAWAQAQDSGERLVDNAVLLSPGERDELVGLLDSISNQLECDIVVHTTNTLDGKTPEAYADDFYDYNGYGFGDEADGVLLMVCMSTRDWSISTTGFCITAINERGLDYLTDEFLPLLSDGDYAGAFTEFAEECGWLIEQARQGTPYGTGSSASDEDTPWGFMGALSAGLGALLGLPVVNGMKNELKVNRSAAPSNYYMRFAAGGFAPRVTANKLGENLARTYIPPVSSSSGGSRTHVGSSGRTHGGRSGKF